MRGPSKQPRHNRSRRKGDTPHRWERARSPIATGEFAPPGAGVAQRGALSAGGWPPPPQVKSAPQDKNQPRPMYGIFVAITVMNCTFASSGSEAM